MKKLLILAFILLSCREELVTPSGCWMTFSDALPVQFWLSDCSTYNESETCGVHHKCWCQPFNADDPVKVQFKDPNNYEFILVVEDANGTIIEELFLSKQLYGDTYLYSTSFIPSSLGISNEQISVYVSSPEITIPSLASYVNIDDGDEEWDVSPNPNTIIMLDLDQSDLLRVTTTSTIYRSIYKLNYSIDVDILEPPLSDPDPEGNIALMPIRFVFYKSGVDVGHYDLTITDEGSFTGVFNLVLTDIPTHFGVRISPNGSGPISNDVQITVTSISASKYEFTKKTCLDIKESHDCTSLIQYYNNRPYAGLVFEDGSPENDMALRVPSIFFHERFVQTDNVIETVSTVIKTSSTVKEQKRLDVPQVPYYFHKKILLALRCSYVAIDNNTWALEEEYKIEEGDRRWPLKKASAFLTKTTSLVRNLL